MNQSFEFIPGMPLIPAKPEDRAWYLELVKLTPDMLDQYRIRPNPVDVRQGLESILQGIAEILVS